MTIRQIQNKDSAAFLKMLLRLDRETKTMMVEPGERSEDLQKVEEMVLQYRQTQSLILIADTGDKIAGFLSAEKGSYSRIRHTAYIVVGILPEYQGQGIGTGFFEELDKWAGQRGITRLELTVMTHNERAIRLYQKNGFEIEGIKRKSMMVDGSYVDEYYMARLL